MSPDQRQAPMLSIFAPSAQWVRTEKTKHSNFAGACFWSHYTFFIKLLLYQNQETSTRISKYSTLRNNGTDTVCTFWRGNSKKHFWHHNNRKLYCGRSAQHTVIYCCHAWAEPAELGPTQVASEQNHNNTNKRFWKEGGRAARARLPCRGSAT